MLIRFLLCISLCIAYVIPSSNVQKLLIVGCGNLGKDVALTFRNTTQIFATTTNITKISNLKEHVDDIILMSDTSKLTKTLCDVDNIFISVAGPTKNIYTNTANIITRHLDELENIHKPVHITFISSASAYGLITNGCKIDESYKPKKFNKRIWDLVHAENIFFEFQKRHRDKVKLCVFRPQVLLSSKPDALLNMVSWSSGRQLSEKFGNTYMGISHHDEIIHAYQWCITHDIQGIVNVNSAPILRKTFFNTVCDKYKIPRPIWSDFEEDYSTMPGGNKIVVCKKLLDSGYKFMDIDYR